MGTTTSLISIEALKRHAKRLHKEIKKNNSQSKLSEAQDLLAKTFGLNNWHEMIETTKKNEEKNEIEKNYLWYCENLSSFSVKNLLKQYPEININIEQGIIKAVKNGNFMTVVNFFEEYLPDNSNEVISENIKITCFNIACTIGKLDLVEYFDHYFEKKSSITPINRIGGLYYAGTHGHLKLVQYLLEDSYIKDILNNQKIVNELFLRTVMNTNMIGVFGHQHKEIIQYLLTSSNIKYRANINTENNQALRNAVFDKDNMKYLLSSPELKEHGDIYAQNGEIFEYILKSGYENQYYEVIDYIIQEYKIEKRPEIMKILEKYNKQRVASTTLSLY